TPTEDFRSHYISNLLTQIDEERIKKRQFRIIADCGGGAASTVVPVLFKVLQTKTTLLHCKPDGFFKNRLPEPNEANLAHLIQQVKNNDVDIGMAWDGDADRIVLVTNRGQYLMGDRTFALAAFHWLRDLQEKPKRIITQVATSDVIRDVAKSVDAEVVETLVGEPNIVSKMKQLNAPIGGEENGGVIYRGWSWTREGLLTALVILDLIAVEGKTLEALDRIFPIYYQVKERVPCKNETKEALLECVKTYIPTDAESNTLDGIKLRYSDGWVLIRPSGTEPIFRIFAEAKTKDRAATLVKQGLSYIHDALEEIKADSTSIKSE
ncbi:MAG: phosphoglucosamine mutase, partial [Candidatus Thorarchaeota archaeon]